MQIRYERPLPELTFEVAAPLHLSLGPDLETVVDKWSLDGIHPPKQLDGGSRFWRSPETTAEILCRWAGRAARFESTCYRPSKTRLWERRPAGPELRHTVRLLFQ